MDCAVVKQFFPHMEIVIWIIELCQYFVSEMLLMFFKYDIDVINLSYVQFL